jgi:predicted ATPase/DNA-binding winged helix-turn-helix (wHTH) protein
VATYRCGEFRVDVNDRRFVRGEREIALEPRVFAVIAALLARAGSLVTRNDLLDAVWGHRYVTPSTLNRTIALARRAFGDESTEPRFIQTVHGAGYRYVGPADTSSDEQRPARAQFGPPTTMRLPARIDELIGRETSLAALADILTRNRAVTVVGPGGMGKTQCALEAARRATPDFPDGVWFFDLAPLERAEEWLQSFGSALGFPSSGDVLLDKLCAAVSERRALVVLDNCERMAGPLGSLVIRLLRSTAALKVLSTSQVPLNFAGEQLLRLPPLELPPATPSPGDTEPLTRFAAVDMMVRRIKAVQPEFELAGASARTVAQICIRLDGMPLALELAAARFSLLSAEQVHDRLVQRFRFLGSDTSGRDQRHRSLQALLEWSYTLLSADEERLLNWCAVFVQTWSVEAAVSVAAALGHDPERAVDLLGSLVNHSLVSVVPGVTPPRYRLLESVRDYALARLRSVGQEADARTAHLQTMVRICRSAYADILSPRMRERVEQLSADLGNIGAAIDASLRAGNDLQEALDILGSLAIFAKARGEYVTVRRWCRMVLTRCPVADTPERARALLTSGMVEVHSVAGVTTGAGLLREAARIATIHQDWWTAAYAHGYCAMALANEGQPEEASEHARVGDSCARRSSDDSLRGLMGLARGWICLARGEPRAALEELLAVRDVGTDVHQIHFVGMYIGLAHFALGDLTAAAVHWLRAMELGIAVGNVRGIAGSIEGCAYVACAAGEWACATRMLAAAGLIRERTENPIFSFWVPFQETAVHAARSGLAASDFHAETRKGLAMRHEDAANEAQAVLWRLAGNPERRASQRTTNRPVGS